MKIVSVCLVAMLALAPVAIPQQPSPSPSPSASPSAGARDFKIELDSLLKDARKPGRMSAPSRQGVGDRPQTITFASYFATQMLQRGCWQDHSDMPDAQRLRATFRVKFGPDGKLASAPEMVLPSRMPAADRPMVTFVVVAQRALKQCEPFQLPPEYRKEGYPSIDIDFRP